MSIEYVARQVRKVRRTLMFSTAVRVLYIKDLKDLSVFLGRGDYRHAGPTDLKRCFSRV